MNGGMKQKRVVIPIDTLPPLNPDNGNREIQL